ncbi:MAG: hypothetical protein U0556_01255 [Dehalococcoidia bacterium]
MATIHTWLGIVMADLLLNELLFLTRLTHLIAGVGWLGEVMVINFVLVPALLRSKSVEQIALLEVVFPRLFKLATILGGLAVGSGAILISWYSQLRLDVLFGSRWGWFVLIGGALTLLLYAFHLFQESRMEHTLASNLIVAVQTNDSEMRSRLLRRLTILPRAGMLVLVVGILLMAAAAHGMPIP